MLVTLVALAVLCGCTGGSRVSSTREPPGSGTEEEVERAVERLVRTDGFPAALAAVTDGDGRVRDYTAGAADLATGAPVPVNGRVRAASNTKTFTAVVVLQLVGEGRVRLDGPVETYLPGLLRGDGIDGRRVTVRHLLQHTSGLPDYTESLSEDPFPRRDRYTPPRELLDLALAHPARFPPGARWEYSNTNYVLAGLLAQAVTGRPLAELVTRRIIEPARLRHTYFPTAGDRHIRGPHPKGYHATRPGRELKDITVMDPSWGWAAGQLITTPRDLSRFYTALLKGDLLEPAQLRQMRTTVGAEDLWPGARYGLGLVSTPLSCGGLAWGHGGDIPGFHTRGGATDDGRSATLALTALPTALPDAKAAARHVLSAVDAALCD
ncbi:D-alanyl-D-alanine carboxypeptidase [Streptomyces leeuwenhoekii]|uniref:D-alanyl-D-alanine carboxypeptidase n=1 Tax=Streptomyces leeuwenhoekii TaxID=1437453 RepID=A0A0F7W1J0_STRLW|nr:D-alanyl-D-alanine carboxypeptidase [Streptomyces leeuwenhoekii]